MNDERDRTLRRLRQDLVRAAIAYPAHDGNGERVREEAPDPNSVAWGFTLVRRMVDQALGIREEPTPGRYRAARRELYESLAAVQHDIWRNWMTYVLNHCATENPDGSVTIPAEKISRWMRQIEQDYRELPDAERESDRDQVDRFWRLLYAGPTPRDEDIDDEIRQQAAASG